MSASTSASDPPSSSRARAATSSPDDGDARGAPAQFGVRFAARVLDYLFGILLAVGVAFVVVKVLTAMTRSGAMTATWAGKIGTLSLGTFAWGFAGTLSYHVLSEAIGGASLGKWICGLRVYSADFSPDGTFLVALRPCTFTAALVRSLALLVDTLFFAAVAYFSMEGSRWHQRLGDKWGHTVVVKAKSTELPAKSPILGLVVGILACAACIAIGILLKVL
jgi:uncharacterized RDD family membrane protein YckC